MSKVIGLFSFHPQCGKTSVAQAMVDHHHFNRIPMAETLKLMIRTMLRDIGLNDDEILTLETGDKQSPFCSYSPTTLRTAYQTLGTEWGRKLIDADIWLNIWNRKVNEQISVWGESVVCDDIRFKNEFDRVLNMGGEMWCINRGEYRPRPAHASESFDPPMHQFTHILQNDGTIEELITKIGKLL